MRVNLECIYGDWYFKIKMIESFFDNPVGRSWVTKMGKMKWEITYEIYSGDTIHCIGKQIGCFFDLERKRPTHVPECMLIEYNKEAGK